MKHRSKLQESINLLHKKGWRVEELKGNYLAYFGTDSPTYHDYHVYTVRQLIRLADSYSKNSRQKTAVKKNTKTESKRERAFVRDELRKNGEDADAIRNKNQFSDTWNWD